MRLRIVVAVVAIAVVFNSSVLGDAAPATKLETAIKHAGDGGAEILADKFEVDRATGWVTARGNVKVRADYHELNADHVRIHQEKGDIEARGNVVIKQSGFGTWSGEYIEYNYKTGAGMTGMGAIQAGVFHISAEEVVRRESGVLEADHICFTTCTNAPGSWHWHVSGRGRYKDNDYVEVFHGIPWLFGVPIGYLPYWYRDLDTHYGVRLVPGYTSRWGAFLLGTYIHNLYAAPAGRIPRLDSSTHLDLRTRRGVAVGEDLSWKLGTLGSGKLETYFAWDERLPNKAKHYNWMSDMDRERYRFQLHHEADFTPRDQFILHGNYLSDSEMLRDFFNLVYRRESIPMNFASYSHREHSWAAGALASGPLNTFYSGVRRLPEGWLNVMPQPLVSRLGINYESQTRAGYFDRQSAKFKNAIPDFMYYPGSWANYDMLRIDTAHRLTAPFKVADVLSLVPRAGYRGTYYSETESSDDVVRHSPDLGIQASVRAVSAWKGDYRHIVEPYLDYSYQPVHYSKSNGRVYGMDRFDRSAAWLDRYGFDGTWLPYDWHGFRPGVRNLIQTRELNGQTRNLLEWDFYAGLPMHKDGLVTKEGVQLAGTKVIWSPTKDVDIQTHTEWDNDNETFAYVDIAGFYNLTERLRIGGGYLGRDHDLYDYGISPVSQWNRVHENLFYGGFTHELNDTWTWSLFTRYDALGNSMDEVGGYIQYGLDCLVFQLRLAYINDFKRIDGLSDRDDDFRVGFLMWLRAEEKATPDEWMTW